MNTERVRGNLPTVRRGDLRLLPRALLGPPVPEAEQLQQVVADTDQQPFLERRRQQQLLPGVVGTARSCSLAYYHAGGFSEHNLTTVSSAFLGRTASWIFLLAFDTSVAHYLGLVEKVGFDGGTGCHNRAATLIKAATLIIRNPVDQDRGAPSGLVGSPQAVGVAGSP